jgi:hypothetical protein
MLPEPLLSELDFQVLTGRKVVDWNSGKVVIGDNESEIQNLIRKETSGS